MTAAKKPAKKKAASKKSAKRESKVERQERLRARTKNDKTLLYR